MINRNKIVHIVGLVFALTTLWLFLSGHYTPLLLSLGVLSVILVTLISLRMNLMDYEQPEMWLQIFKSIPYVFWLIVEILKSNIDVCKRILNPKLPISPRLVTLKSTQQGSLARVFYANSITLTPGTISIDVEGNDIEVHALAEEGVKGLETGEMDNRISKMEINNHV